MFPTTNRRLLLIAFTVLFSMQLNARADLVQNGTSDYAIVLSETAIPAEQTAAEELSDYLHQISGAKLPVVTEAAYDGKRKMLAVGFNAKLPATLQPAAFGPLNTDELLIVSEGDTILLGGGRPRGTLYAVYEYLHRLGVRWYTPESTKVPSQKTIPLPGALYRYKPPMASRSLLIGSAPTEAWSARNRQNQFLLWSGLADKYGGGYGQGPDMHTFWRLLSVPLLKAHPEWMAELDGKREQPVGSAWGVCLSNEELRKFLIAQTLDWARKHPEKKGVWIGQNDGSKPCSCPKCTAFYEAHGGKPSSLVIQLLNEFAEALHQEMPDRVAKTLAYSWSLEPPANMRVHENTMIMFSAPGEFAKTIEADTKRDRLRAAIADWRKIAPNLEVYLYTAPWENYWFVEPATYSAAQNIKWAANNGLSSVFAQVSGFGTTFGSESIYLRAWVYARLIWDPTQDPQALIEDFARGYYGPTSDTVLKAIKLVHTDVLDNKGELRLYNKSATVPNQINPQTMRTINEMYEKTYNSLQDPVYKKRLGMDWIAYLWTDFWLGFSGPGKYDAATKSWAVPMQDGALRSKYGKLAKQFMIENKINVLKERVPLNPTRLSLDKMGISWPASKLQDGNASAVVVPAIGGKIAEFRDSTTDFDPLKPYWGLLITQYPQLGSWRDTVNKEDVPSYVPAQPTTANPDIVDLIGNAGGSRVRKQVTMQNGALQVDLTATPAKTGESSFSTSFMLDLQDKAFGDFPTIYIEKKNGEWTKRVLGSETTFWYIAGALDIKDTTGRIVFAAEKRPEGLLLTFDPNQVTQIPFEYDRYKSWAEDQGHMAWITPTNTIKNAPAGTPIPLSIRLQILPDAQTAIKP